MAMVFRLLWVSDLTYHHPGDLLLRRYRIFYMGCSRLRPISEVKPLTCLYKTVNSRSQVAVLGGKITGCAVVNLVTIRTRGPSRLPLLQVWLNAGMLVSLSATQCRKHAFLALQLSPS